MPRADRRHVIDLAVHAALISVDRVRTPAQFDRWRAELTAAADWNLPPGTRLLVTVPSWWARPRRTRLATALEPVTGPIEFIGRAQAIVDSHCDSSVTACAVVEPMVLATAAEPIWLWQRLIRVPGGWQRVGASVVGPDGTGPADCDDVTMIVVADADPDQSAAEEDKADDLVAVQSESMCAVLRRRTAVGRVIAVDQKLLCAYAGFVDNDLPSPTVPAIQRADRTRRRRLTRAVGAAVAVGAVVGVAGLIRAPAQRATGSPPRQEVAVGRASLTVPAQWRRSEVQAQEGAVPIPARTVFVEPSDGRRIIVAAGQLRPGATRESVARSLANRIAQRGDGGVTEFSATTKVAGREVIGYRESPASGAVIAWYVVVEAGVQVSIGCQAGTSDQPIVDECSRAVGSVRVR